jgi:hypothetical protein
MWRCAGRGSLTSPPSISTPTDDQVNINRIHGFPVPGATHSIPSPSSSPPSHAAPPTHALCAACARHGAHAPGPPTPPRIFPPQPMCRQADTHTHAARHAHDDGNDTALKHTKEQRAHTNQPSDTLILRLSRAHPQTAVAFPTIGMCWRPELQFTVIFLSLKGPHQG